MDFSNLTRHASFLESVTSLSYTPFTTSETQKLSQGVS